MTLTELIKDNFVYFDSYRQGFFYYILYYEGPPYIENPYADITGTDDFEPTIAKYQFTIPHDDIGNGSLGKRMKAIECMRWIRKAQDSGELIKLPR